MKKLKPVLVLLVASAAFSAVRPQDSSQLVRPEKVPFCNLAMNPDKHDGDLVITEAVAYNSIHTIVLTDPICADEQTEHGKTLFAQPMFLPPYKLGTELDQQFRKAIHENGSVRLIFTGTVESKNEQYGPEGLPFRINIQSMVSVHLIPPAEREALGIPPGAQIINTRPTLPPP